MSRWRDRALHGVGFVLLGLILARAAIIGPASSCARAPLHRGGDMVPFFCADYGAAWSGWPLLVAGLAGIAVGFLTLLRAADASRFPTTLRAALVLAAAGSTLVYGAWSEGSAGTCATTYYGSDPPMPSQTFCTSAYEPWYAPALVAGGALVGAGATLAAAVAVRAAQGSGSEARVASP